MSSSRDDAATIRQQKRAPLDPERGRAVAADYWVERFDAHTSTFRCPSRTAARKQWTTRSWRAACATASTTPSVCVVHTREISNGSERPV